MTSRRLPLLVALASSPALAQATFQGLGDLPAGTFYSEGRALSADGSAAVGATTISGGGPFGQVLQAFRWTRSSLMQPAFDIAGASSAASPVSADGSIVVGWADFGAFSPQGIQAFMWSTASGSLLLGDLPGGPSAVPHSFARAISADGSTIVGIGQSDRERQRLHLLLPALRRGRSLR